MPRRIARAAPAATTRLPALYGLTVPMCSRYDA